MKLPAGKQKPQKHQPGIYGLKKCLPT